MQKNISKICLLVVAMVSCCVAPLNAMENSGMTDETLRMSIDTLSEREIIDDAFLESNRESFTRAEFAKISIHTAGLQAAVRLKTEKGAFRDVDPGHWAAGYIHLAVEKGFFTGYEDGSFKPDQPVTFKESLTVLIRVLGYTPDACSSLRRSIPDIADKLAFTKDFDINSQSCDMGPILYAVHQAMTKPILLNGSQGYIVSGTENTQRKTLMDQLPVLTAETDHFQIYTVNKNRDIAAAVGNELESNYTRITNDLKIEPDNKVKVKIYPDLKTFHTAIGSPEAPDWAIGLAKNGVVHMVSPDNPGPCHSYHSVIKAAAHEFTHIIIRRYNTGELPIWLNEGTASYEGRNIENIDSVIQSDIEDDKIPSFTELENRKEFAEKKGYEFSTTLVEFIISEYGYDKLIDLIKSPGDMEAILNLSKDELYLKWKDYLIESTPVDF